MPLYYQVPSLRNPSFSSHSRPQSCDNLASATDRELWQGPKAGSPRITDFGLSAQPQKFETLMVTIGYKNGQLLPLHVILALPELSIRGTGQTDRSSGDENALEPSRDAQNVCAVIKKAPSLPAGFILHFLIKLLFASVLHSEFTCRWSQAV